METLVEFPNGETVHTMIDVDHFDRNLLEKR